MCESSLTIASSLKYYIFTNSKTYIPQIIDNFIVLKKIAIFYTKKLCDILFCKYNGLCVLVSFYSTTGDLQIN